MNLHSLNYPRTGVMKNSVWYNNGDEIDRLAERKAVFFHSQLNCKLADSCVIHNPSDHLMVRWPRLLRSSALVERTCPHGIGHPDPDSLKFFESIGRRGYDVHGCDGCCVPEPEPDELPERAPEIWKKTTVVVEHGYLRSEVTVDADGWVRLSGDSITPALLRSALDVLENA
ncbi:MAG TPA: hypothetical protein VLA89_17375 [Gemmatimonadales bacterium]|nr:hypothetical protein [Gemmatimonadales bacterium]